MPPPKSKKSSRATHEKLNRLQELLSNPKTFIVLDVEGTSDESRMGASYSFDQKSSVLKIAINNLNAHDKKLVFEAITTEFDNGAVILKDTKQETLKSYKEYTSKNEYKNTLEFFDGIIPKDDFYALKMSLYLRSEMDKGHHRYIASHKQDIRARFGDRGANIANLCSAGYFENELKPLFNQVPKQMFDEYYELVVGKKARALFVYSDMSTAELEEAFSGMLEKALKYHMDDFRVHGIGKINVDKLKKFFASLTFSEEDPYVIVKDFEKEDPFTAIEFVVKIVS